MAAVLKLWKTVNIFNFQRLMKKLILLFLLTSNAKTFTEKAFISEITNLTENLIFFKININNKILFISPKETFNENFEIPYETFDHDQENGSGNLSAIGIPENYFNKPSDFTISTPKLNSYKTEKTTIDINFFKAIASKTGEHQFGFVNTNSIFQKIQNSCSKQHSHNISIKISWISLHNCFKIEAKCKKDAN